jgi:hypothetical protein
MIPHQWFFFHSKLTSLTYLRYLSLATCRYTHPDWPIYVYDIKDDFDWGDDEGFEYNLRDYSKEAKEVLGCQFRDWEPADAKVKEMPPQNQSDIFSLAILREQGGWYSDTDVLFLKSHQHLSDQDYAFVGFGGQYYHVGMFGSKKDGWAVSSIVETATRNFDAGSYNSTGTHAILKHNATNDDWNNQFKKGDPSGGRNYHLPDWTWVGVLPQHHHLLVSENFNVDGNALALHLYGSLPSYANLNKVYSPEYVMSGASIDIVSRTCRNWAKRDGDARRAFLVK